MSQSQTDLYFAELVMHLGRVKSDPLGNTAICYYEIVMAD